MIYFISYYEEQLIFQLIFKMKYLFKQSIECRLQCNFFPIQVLALKNELLLATTINVLIREQNIVRNSEKVHSMSLL